MNRPQTHIIGYLPASAVKATALLLAILHTASLCARAEGRSVPAAVQVPAGNTLEFRAHGVGVQIYTWNATLATWGASTPHAVLFNDGGVAGIHYAGPTWQNDDGSKIVGKKVAAVTVDADAIPWLLLSAVSTSGPGLFADVTYVQRLETKGGLAPTAPGTFNGEQALVPYSAEYLFYHPEYVFTEIPLPGEPHAQAFGINDRGLVSGTYYPSTTSDLGFVFDNGTLTTGISGPGADFTLLGPANNHGLAIGNFGEFTIQHAAYYDVAGATWTALPDITGMPLNFGNGINDAGQAVGTAFSGGNSGSGTGPGLDWIWDGNDYSFFTIPGADPGNGGAFASGINNDRQVCGYYADAQNNYHGFLKDGSHVITLDAPGADLTGNGNGTFGSGVNNQGAVAGSYIDKAQVHHGFIWSHGTFTIVDVPPATFPLATGTELYDINIHGDIVGAYIHNGHHFAFVARRQDGGH